MNFSFSLDDYNKLSDTEKYFLNYIDTHQASLDELTITQLSDQANVSPATIIRTLKKIGFDGFSSFKYFLKENDKPSFNVLKQATEEIGAAILKNQQEVSRTIQFLEFESIERAVRLIDQKDKIFVFAQGFSAPIGQEIQIKLSLSSKNCQLYDTPNFIRNVSWNGNPLLDSFYKVLIFNSCYYPIALDNEPPRI